ncbi:hypothetical protein H2198_005336 [Neophaeococcomyces mojaviensis]|uniref:Uncharacterized protein n=1 Tax=Neophaeococcomyces mojaviensis TaxID=3383035 RepID=A0ACC3A622_9EURO|nr:hypothetical protein H2198_005336 [Knufia sp. JES_112]
MDARLSSSAGTPSDAIHSANGTQAVLTFPHSVGDTAHSLQLSQRNASPSRASIHSFSTISTSPQLKRKYGHKHIRQQLHPSHSTSAAPTLTSSTAAQQLASSRNSTSPSRLSRVQLTRANTAPSPKRAPASHSSYGVETIAGPPPSFDTQRTLSQERVWRVDRSKSLRMTTALERTELQEPISENKDSNDLKPNPPSTPQLVQSSPDTADTQSIPTPTDGEEVAVMDVQDEQGLGLGHSEVASKADSKASSESHKSEDLFLNIARTDAARPTSSKGDKRRSRISLPFFNSGVRPATSHHTPAPRIESDPSITPRAGLKTYHTKRASLGLPPDDIPGSQVELKQETDGLYSQRSSTLYADTIRPVQRSSTTLRNNRLVSESGYLDKPKFGEQNTTESTTSTTAPSTVWDELDDLKSRIRKLELTGKLPPSSAAAMSSAERPRTATTAATTMSGSPKHTKAANPPQSTIEGVPPTIHPLLHDALANAKSTISHDVYQKLLATAQDALQLAAITGYDNVNLHSGVPAVTERQLRRRTESMCRSLTELAITLASEAKAPQSSYRPASREYHISPNVGIRSRRYSNEPSDRAPVSTRVHSRLETRRVSTQLGYGNARHSSPELESALALPQYPASGGRVIRPSGTLRTRRTQTFHDETNDEDDPTPGPVVRPVSRAMTDVASVQRPSRDYVALSREYTSQHPMPTKTDTIQATRTPLPSHLSTNFTSRRKYASPVHATAADSSPLAAKPSWGRISIVHQDINNTRPSDIELEAPSSARSITTRRSLGFASRFGSSVGNRLRAVKSERQDAGTTESINSSPPTQGTYS